MARVSSRAPSAFALLGLLGGCLLACSQGTRTVDGNESSSGRSRRTTQIADQAGSDVPLTYRVLLAVEVTGGTGGTGGGVTGAGGSGSAPGAAGAGGTTDATGTTTPSCQSAYCGDGCHDSSKEECDDGAGSPGNFCNWACQVQDNWASHTESGVTGSARVKRALGRGRHSVAANSASFAVGLVEQLTPSEQVVRVARYTAAGVAISDTVMSDGTWVADRADPVVAVLGNGDVVTAFTEFGGDGDGLGIALRRIRAGQTQPDPVVWASVPSFASQCDADILALSDRILVAYTDEYDAVSGPDITLREFGLDLKPIATTPLGNSSDVEGRVALAKLGSSWGAAWRRAAADGTEYLEVYDAATTARWSVGPYAASDPDDAPALVGLDGTRRMVLYTRAATGSQAYPVGQLYYAVLDTAQPGAVTSSTAVPTTTAYADYSGLAMRSPMAVQAGNQAVIAWSSAQRTSDPAFANGEEVWYERVTFTASGASIVPSFGVEVAMPRFASGRLGDQRSPALALLEPGTALPGGALVAAWDDYGETLGSGSAEPEVAASLAPLDLHRAGTIPASDCTTAAPCSAGTGRCTASNQCASGLVCSTSAAKNFGYAADVGVCVAAHCADGTLNNGETLTDCGGTDCGSCQCGNGIVTPAFGEVCDTAGNSATCDNDCTLPVCGDGVVNAAAGEQCDLGAGNGPNAPCLANCTVPPVCTNGATCLNVSSIRGTSSSSQIGVHVRIVNNSTQSQSLNGITLRYWFTGDGSSAYTFACDYGGSRLACSAISGVATDFSPIRVGADRVMTITLNTSVTLSPGQHTDNMQFRFVKTDNSTTTQTNDYSYSQSTLTTNLNIGMYRNGTMIWGQAPSQSYACGNAITELGEICDNATNTNCRPDCQGFNVVNGTACKNSAQCLAVEHYSNDNASDNQLRPYFRIVNRSGVPIALNRIKLKYWFSSESTTATFATFCTSGPGGNCSVMTPSVARISPTFATADAAATLTFTATTVLAATDATNSLQINVNRSDWGNMNETNDWSRIAASSFTAAPKFALYVDDQLWWGEEAK